MTTSEVVEPETLTCVPGLMNETVLVMIQLKVGDAEKPGYRWR